jgi:hypothetical protein
VAAAKSLTPEQRTMRARLAAHARWAREDPGPNVRRAAAGLLEKFRREILAEQGDVAEPELTRRAESRRREHLTRIAFEASRKRQAGKAAAHA